MLVEPEFCSRKQLVPFIAPPGVARLRYTMKHGNAAHEVGQAWVSRPLGLSGRRNTFNGAATTLSRPVIHEHDFVFDCDFASIVAESTRRAAGCALAVMRQLP